MKRPEYVVDFRSNVPTTATAFVDLYSEKNLTATSVPPDDARRAMAAERARREEERISARAARVTRLEDPVSKIDIRAVIELFSTTRDANTASLTDLLIRETAHQSSLYDVIGVMRTVVGDTVEINVNSAKRTVTNLFELLLLQQMSKNIALEEPIRQHLLHRYIDREFGPKPSEINVKNYGASEPNSRQAPAGGRNRTSEVVERLNSAKAMVQSRGGNGKPNSIQGAGPFGNL